MEKKSNFVLTDIDQDLLELVKKTDKKILAHWAIACAERVMPFFEKKYPKDERPRKAIETLQEWIQNGIFKMAVIRKASLDSHAAAREVGEDSAARSAARAAGQAVATAHVKTHAMGAAIYALQAIDRNVANRTKAKAAINKEKNWQVAKLTKLNKHSDRGSRF